MRAGIVLVLACAACSPQLDASSDDAPSSVRERLERGPTRLFISSIESAGSITAQRRVTGGWSAGFVELGIESGELVTSMTASGKLLVERFGLWLSPIEIPASVIGRAAQLTQVHLTVDRPAALQGTAWTGDDQVEVNATLDLSLAWALTIDGSTSALGSPDLPPLPVELVLTGDGPHVQAEVRLRAPGTLWSWADLVRLDDLTLILDAETVSY